MGNLNVNDLLKTDTPYAEIEDAAYKFQGTFENLMYMEMHNERMSDYLLKRFIREAKICLKLADRNFAWEGCSPNGRFGFGYISSYLRPANEIIERIE